MFLTLALQGGYYLLASLSLTRRSSTPQIAWLRLLLLGLTGFLVLFAVLHSAEALAVDPPWAGLVSTCTALLILYAISWASLTHGRAFAKPPKEVLQALIAPLDKYRKSRQSEGEAKRILAKLDQAVLAGSLHREAGLTLPMLATQVGAKPNMVSQALNESLGVGFFDYINGHRIEEAKLLLKDEENGSILDIAYAVGFNSKSTFNAAFKKHTGQTPSMFRKSTSL
jgi:AraC-like DNA-binding protein